MTFSLTVKLSHPLTLKNREFGLAKGERIIQKSGKQASMQCIVPV